jgi:hypothetical protein
VLVRQSTDKTNTIDSDYCISKANKIRTNRKVRIKYGAIVWLTPDRKRTVTGYKNANIAIYQCQIMLCALYGSFNPNFRRSQFAFGKKFTVRGFVLGWGQVKGGGIK